MRKPEAAPEALALGRQGRPAVQLPDHPPVRAAREGTQELIRERMPVRIRERLQVQALEAQGEHRAETVTLLPFERTRSFWVTLDGSEMPLTSLANVRALRSRSFHLGDPLHERQLGRGERVDARQGQLQSAPSRLGLLHAAANVPPDGKLASCS